MSHDCPVKVCQRVVSDDDLLMCGPHWRLVPPRLRSAVWDAWDDRAGLGTIELLRAQHAAIAAVDADPRAPDR